MLAARYVQTCEF